MTFSSTRFPKFPQSLCKFGGMTSAARHFFLVKDIRRYLHPPRPPLPVWSRALIWSERCHINPSLLSIIKVGRPRSMTDRFVQRPSAKEGSIFSRHYKAVSLFQLKDSQLTKKLIFFSFLLFLWLHVQRKVIQSLLFGSKWYCWTESTGKNNHSKCV